MITQSEAPVPEEMQVHKHRIDLSPMPAATGETGLTGGARSSVKPGKTHSKEGKNIKSVAFSPLRKDPIPN